MTKSINHADLTFDQFKRIPSVKKRTRAAKRIAPHYDIETEYLSVMDEFYARELPMFNGAYIPEFTPMDYPEYPYEDDFCGDEPSYSSKHFARLPSRMELIRQAWIPPSESEMPLPHEKDLVKWIPDPSSPMGMSPTQDYLLWELRTYAPDSLRYKNFTRVMIYAGPPGLRVYTSFPDYGIRLLFDTLLPQWRIYQEIPREFRVEQLSLSSVSVHSRGLMVLTHHQQYMVLNPRTLVKLRRRSHAGRGLHALSSDGSLVSDVSWRRCRPYG